MTFRWNVLVHAYPAVVDQRTPTPPPAELENQT
jgi:hypothetical protein